MVKIFVADDEDLSRQGIRNCVEKHPILYSICGEAPDGEMALPLIQELKPDVLIADVHMPFMDGLELAAVVKRTMSWVHIIILSGHDEFKYAQQAVSIGVDAYILKPVNSEKLLKALAEVALRIKREKEVYLHVEETLKRDELEKTIIQEHFLSRLVTGNIPVNEVMKFDYSHNINIVAKKYLVCRIALTNLGSEDLKKVRALCDRLFEEKSNVIWFVKGADSLVFIIKGDDDETVREMAYETAQMIRHQFMFYLSIDISVGIGSIIDRIGGLPRSYQDACSVLSSIRMRTNCIIGIEDVEKSQIPSGVDVSSDMPLSERLRHATKEDLPSIIAKHFCNLEETTVDSVLYRYYLLMDILITASRLSKRKIDTSPDIAPQKLLILSESLEECTTYARQVLEEMIEQRDMDHTAYSREIQTAKAYINQNYGDPSISLHTTAREVRFSPNHFSTVFSQETGETFIEYLTQRRIAAAKDLLLNTQKRTSDIAFEVGYSDPNYFSYVFKKKTGKSPKEFKVL